MSKFFPGCRVRILWSYGWPELAGQEGRVVERSPDGGAKGVCEWRVAPDCWGTFLAPHKGLHGADLFAPNGDQLEPLIPEGAAPSELSYTELMDRLKAGEVECV